MILVPVGTDIRLRNPPLANYGLIFVNIVIFLFTHGVGGRLGLAFQEYWTLDAARPLLWQYVTYQFLHGDVWHLVGNMLFLWIFGNAVCDRMGNLPYLFFYLAGGVFAGLVFAYAADNPMVGASGAIAAVTTAFLALYPRVHVHMLLWVFIFIQSFSVPAMFLIVFKIILWDNVIAPSIDRSTIVNVAYSAHLGGYAFGFLGAMLLLGAGALPRNPFDLISLWARRGERSRDGRMTEAGIARPVRIEELGSRPLEPLQVSQRDQLRADAIDLVRTHAFAEAAGRYAELRAVDPAAVLPRPAQLELSNYLLQTGQHADAAAAYRAYLAAYPHSADAGQVHLLLGIIFSRHLGDVDTAAAHLSEAVEMIQLESQRELAAQELRRLGRPARPPTT